MRRRTDPVLLAAASLALAATLFVAAAAPQDPGKASDQQAAPPAKTQAPQPAASKAPPAPAAGTQGPVMFGGGASRNMVSAERGLPSKWDVETGLNVKWSQGLGSQSYAGPIVHGGKVFAGTNNRSPGPNVTRFPPRMKTPLPCTTTYTSSRSCVPDRTAPLGAYQRTSRLPWRKSSVEPRPSRIGAAAAAAAGTCQGVMRLP